MCCLWLLGLLTESLDDTIFMGAAPSVLPIFVSYRSATLSAPYFGYLNFLESLGYTTHMGLQP